MMMLGGAEQIDELTFGVLPVVKRKGGNPNWVDTWSEELLAKLVHLREVEKKRWNQISKLLGRKLPTCHRRYIMIVAARPPAPIVEKPRPPRLHEELGIRTFTIIKTDYASTVHQRRMTITLSAGIQALA